MNTFMKILVTGAEGFVGRAICEQMSVESHEIFKLISPRGVSGKNAENTFKADISDGEQMHKVNFPEKIDVLIHCAGLAHQFGDTAWEDFEKINVRGSANVCELAIRLQAGHFIQISSVSVYGKNQTGRIVTEENVCKPEGFYGLSKFKAEKAVREICSANGVNLTILRLATVIGEGDQGNFAKLLRAIARKRFVWIGRGKNLKSLIYKDDVGQACRILSAKKRNGAEIFNISAEPLEMSEIVREAARALETKIPEFHISDGLVQNLLKLNRFFKIERVRKISGKIEKWLSDDAYSAKKIYEEYGIKAETPVSEAIEREAAWIKKRKSE